MVKKTPTDQDLLYVASYLGICALSRHEVSILGGEAISLAFYPPTRPAASLLTLSIDAQRLSLYFCLTNRAFYLLDFNTLW